MTVFESKSYVSYMQNAILSDGKKKHGIVKALAEKLRCHPTFISQVMSGKADLNHDQAIRFCNYLELTQEETEFFINLLNRDRAASTEAKAHFQRILDEKISERRVFQKRANLKSSLRTDQEGQYLARWVYPVAHAALQIPNLRTEEKIAKLLDIDIADAKHVLEMLENLKLAKRTSGSWVATEGALHIGKDSPFTANFHANMRLKTAANFVSRKRSMEQTHFSSVFAISKAVSEEVREAFLRSLKDAREKMVDSDPEVLYVLCLDYYPLS